MQVIDPNTIEFLKNVVEVEQADCDSNDMVLTELTLGDDQLRSIMIELFGTKFVYKGVDIIIPPADETNPMMSEMLAMEIEKELSEELPGRLDSVNVKL